MYSSSTNGGKHVLGFLKVRARRAGCKPPKSAAEGNWGGIYMVIKTLKQYIS
jgi:hypothetical protein